MRSASITQHDDLGKADGAKGVAGRKLLGVVGDFGAAAQACGVEQLHVAAVPGEVAGDGVARQSRLGSGDHAILAEDRVDERRFAGIGPADDGDAKRALRLGFFGLAGFTATSRLGFEAESGKAVALEIAEAETMLGGDRHWLSETELEGFVEAFVRGAAFALVGDQDHGAAGRARDTGKQLVGCGDTVARIDDEQHEIGGGQGRFRLLAHTIGDGAALGVLEACRVEKRDGVTAKLRLALAPVAREPWKVGDERVTRARQAVEKGRLADVRSADYCDFWRHGLFQV